MVSLFQKHLGHMPSLYEKLVKKHTVTDLGDDEVLLYISFHIMNEYTSPQAFSGLHAAERNVWRPSAHLGVVDHVNSTRRAGHGDGDEAAELLITNFIANCQRHEIRYFDHNDDRQGIEHVVVPEQGLAVPGQVIACGDSHTTTYGAFGALGFGIGTSEVEHVLATQTLVYRPLKPMRVTVDGDLNAGITAKDIIMAAVQKIGADGASGYAVEFCGEAISALDIAGRMTVCNMAVEMGARAAIIAPDEKVLEYISNRPLGPYQEKINSLRDELFDLQSDADAVFAKEVSINIKDIPPLITWGTSPDQSIAIDEQIPLPESLAENKRGDAERALHYMDLKAGTAIKDLAIDMAFIGSCTNSRIEDLRAAAAIVKHKKVHSNVRAIIVAGSRQVKQQAEEEGLADIFINAGFEWRSDSGCSMCLAMNDDVADSGTRIISSTNRNFEGRQGRGARTHLASPAMVAYAAINGCISDVREAQNA